MLRILEVGGGLPGWAGTEKYILDLSQELLERGHRVTIGCANGSTLAQRTDQAGVPRVALEMRHTMDWRQLVRHLRTMQRKYDVVNIHGYRDYIIPALAARLARIPAVVMTRHLPHAFQSRWRARLCSCVVYDRIIAVSHFVKQVLLESGVPADRVAVVHNGVRTQLGAENDHTFREEFGIPPQAFLVAAAGRIEPQKGFDILVRAMQSIDGHCMICGSGDRSELNGLVGQLGLTGRVHLSGFRQDVSRLWACADVVVVPSTSFDCFPYVAIEAFAAGKPVIASRIGGIPEACDSECAILVPPGDVDTLAAAIGNLAVCGERRLAMGMAARARAGRFTVERMVDGVEHVYYGLMDEKKCQIQ